MQGKEPGWEIQLITALVVLAIIVGLSISPVINAKRKAGKYECQVRLQRIAVAAMVYSTDWDGRLPLSLEPFTWARTYLPDNTSQDFTCPAWKKQYASLYPTSYGYNVRLGGLTRLPKAESIALAWDGATPKTEYYAELRDLAGCIDFDRHAPEHQRRANIAFCDGHVGWIEELDVKLSP